MDNTNQAGRQDEDMRKTDARAHDASEQNRESQGRTDDKQREEDHGRA